MELFLVAALAYGAGRFSSKDDGVLPSIGPLIFTYAIFRGLDAIYVEGKRQLGSK